MGTSGMPDIMYTRGPQDPRVHTSDSPQVSMLQPLCNTSLVSYLAPAELQQLYSIAYTFLLWVSVMMFTIRLSEEVVHGLNAQLLIQIPHAYLKYPIKYHISVYISLISWYYGYTSACCVSHDSICSPITISNQQLGYSP